MFDLSSDSPLISVVIPAYNAARHLSETLDCVRAQRYRNFEIIVVDDGSTDETAHIAQRCGDVRYERQEQAGAGIARNRGVAMARGELLTFLDSDDLWPADKLALQLAAYRAAPREDGVPLLVYGHVKQFFSSELDQRSRAGIQLSPQPRPAYLPGSLMVSPADFRAVGDYAPGLGEGVDWHLRAIDARCHVHLMPDVLLFRRIHGNNLGRTEGLDKREYARIVKAALDRRRAAAKSQSSAA